MKNPIAEMIDRSNSFLIAAVGSVIVAILPQTPLEAKLVLGLSASVLAAKSEQYLDKAKDNPQRRIFEDSMKKGQV